MVAAFRAIGPTRFGEQTGIEITIQGDKELDRFFRGITKKLQRGAIRKAVRAGGSVLIREIRKNLDTMVSSESASRGGIVRLARRTGKKTSLKRAIGQRAWSVPTRGIIGTVVGGRWPEGAHAHLVEFGHEIWSSGGRRGRGTARPTGFRTTPIPFQRRATQTAKGDVLRAQANKMRSEMRRLRAR